MANERQVVVRIIDGTNESRAYVPYPLEDELTADQIGTEVPLDEILYDATYELQDGVYVKRGYEEWQPS